jgi:F-type H+-transporting ATPase subunit delta
MLSVMAKRYARALGDVVTGPASSADASQALAELRVVEQIIASSADLRNALLSPAVAPSRKRAVIARLTEPMGVARAVRNFLFVVIDHRRIHDFSSIVDAFEALLDERLGLVRADVSSARELTPSERSSLQGQLSRLAGKQAKLRFSTDPALIGGVVARVGSTVYDGSVQGQLERLRTKLGSN